jgi:hypothetical protein
MTNTEIFSRNNRKLFVIAVNRAKDCISTELDGETVILDTVSGIYSGLDPIGTYIWNLLEQPATVSTLRDAILERYDVTEEQCVADLLCFLKELAAKGMILAKDE